MGDNQVFPSAYGHYALDLRTDLHLVEWEGTLFPEAFRLLHTPGSNLTPQALENTWYHEAGGCLFVAAQRQLGPPYHCRPWGFMYRLSDDDSERTLPPPPKPDWLPPRFTDSEKRDAEADEPRADQYLMAAAWDEDQGHLEEAFADIEDAVQTTPHTLRTLINAAGQYGDHNRDDRAGELLNQALELQPNHFETLLNLGIHYGKIGKYDECRHYLLQADALQPNHPAVQHFLRQLDSIAR
jgi:tetratricopeptide (TPR) repeat protein